MNNFTVHTVGLKCCLHPFNAMFDSVFNMAYAKPVLIRLRHTADLEKTIFKLRLKHEFLGEEPSMNHFV